MNTYATRILHLKLGDTEILRYTQKLFQPHGLSAICEFYSQLADLCLEYCENELFPSLCESHEHGSQKYCYSLTCEPDFVEEGRLSIRLDVLLYRIGGEICQSASVTHLWDTDEQIIIEK